jgi:hypothetical protein
MSRWIRTAGLVLVPALLVSVALLGCSGDKKGPDKKGPPKKDGDGDEGTGKLEPVKVGSGTISGMVKLKEGLDLKDRISELEADLKKKIDANKNANACKEAYTQTSWIFDKSSRGVANVVVWIMPEKDDQFFNVKDLAAKLPADKKVVVLDQPHCHFEPRVVVLFPDYIDPDKPKTEDGDPNYVSTGQKFYAVNPTTIEHNTKLLVPSGGGKDASSVVPKGSTKQNPEKGFDLTAAAQLRPNKIAQGQIRIACDIHNWMSGSAWVLPHPLAAITNEKGEYKIDNVPDSGKVRLFVWHEEAGFINEGGNEGQPLDLKAKDTKQNFTITKVK